MKLVLHLCFCTLFLIGFGLDAVAQSKGKYWKHILQSNERLSNVAKKYGLTTTQIRAINKDNDDTSFLNIPVEIKRNGFRKQRGSYLMHRVNSKDALHRLAYRYRTTTRKLMKLNQLKESVLQPGQLLLVPNSPLIKENTMIGYFSFGFSSASDWEGKTRANYSINSRYHYRKKVQKPPFQTISDFKVAMGVRREFGKRFYKNVDRIEFRNKLEYAINNKLSSFIFTNLRTQLLNSYIYKTDGTKRIVSAPFTPGYGNISAGFTLFNDFLNLDLSIIDLRTTSVLKQEIYQYRNKAYGLTEGSQFKVEPGVSIQADLFYYKDRKLEINSSTYVFANTKKLVLDMRSTLSYQINKVIRITALVEVYQDKDFSDFVQFRQEILTGFTFRK